MLERKSWNIMASWAELDDEETVDDLASSSDFIIFANSSLHFRRRLLPDVLDTFRRTAQSHFTSTPFIIDTFTYTST